MLGPDDRDALIRHLLGHVVRTLQSAGLRVIVLAPDQLPLAGVDVWTDASQGLNPALSAALCRLAGPVMIVPSDLPWLEPHDVVRLIGEPGDVVVARAADGGTNALLLRRHLTPAFGPGSALVHAADAHRRGLSCRVVTIDGFERDLDDEVELARAMHRARGLVGWERYGAGAVSGSGASNA